MSEKAIKRILIIAVSILLLSPLFWDFFRSSLHYLLYLFGLLVLWIFLLWRQSLNDDASS